MFLTGSRIILSELSITTYKVIYVQIQYICSVKSCLESWEYKLIFIEVGYECLAHTLLNNV